MGKVVFLDDRRTARKQREQQTLLRAQALRARATQFIAQAERLETEAGGTLNYDTIGDPRKEDIG